MERTVIDQMVDDHGELARHLLEAGQPSLLNNSDAAFRKSLTLAAASSFESQVKAHLLAFVSARSSSDALTIAFVKNKALERQYHTLFEWKGTSANSFFGLFGAGFRQHMAARTKADKTLDDSIRAFLELGNLRNEIAHQDFVSYPMEKTVTDVYDLYKRARMFVDGLPSFLAGYVEAPAPVAPAA